MKTTFSSYIDLSIGGATERLLRKQVALGEIDQVESDRSFKSITSGPATKQQLDEWAMKSLEGIHSPMPGGFIFKKIFVAYHFLKFGDPFFSLRHAFRGWRIDFCKKIKNVFG